RHGVDVIKAGNSIAIIDDNFDAADIETSRPGDPFGCFDEVGGGIDRRHSNGGATGLRNARVSRAQIKIIAPAFHFDRVEEPPAKCLKPNDVSVARRNIILNEKDLVDRLWNHSITD